MPLIDLRTNLKTLKFGKDQRGGGSSNQPYIRTEIPENDSDLLNFDDGLIRGGTVSAVKHSVIDLARISKFFKDAPKGPLFLIKQVGLQLSNPKLETGPLRSNRSGIVGNIINAGLNLLNNNGIGSTRIYNLGINTLAQIPVNAFGTHFERHGLTPIQNESTKYANIVANKEKEDNRLVILRDRLILRNEVLKLNKRENKSLGRLLSENGVFSSNVSNFIIAKLTNQNAIIDRYIGGPGSVYGIGNTTLRRFDYTPAINEFSSKYMDEVKNQNAENLFETNQLVNQSSLLGPTPTVTLNSNNRTIKIEKDETIVSQNNYNTEQTILPEDKKNYFIDTRIRRGSPGRLKNRSDYTQGGALDEITALPIFRAQSPSDVADQGKIRDLVKFRFEAIDTDDPNYSNFIVFRAFIKGISFPINPEWSGVKYNGRGEQFYVYNGFTSTISFNFQLAAQSRSEMKPMYQKLNYLISNCTPDYKSNKMRGPLMKLTIGNLIYRQPGFISSLNPVVNDEAPWEIALDELEGGNDRDMMELPHMLDVACTFTPIWNFLPQKSINKSPFIADKGTEVASGERWIPNTNLYKSDITNIDNSFRK